MRKTIVESIASSLRELNKDGFVDDSAMTEIDSLSLYSPSHPGEILKELILEPMNLTIKAAAHHLGVHRKTLSRIVSGKGSVSPELALRLELVFNNLTAEHWLSIQNSYDLWQIKEKKGASVFQIVPFKALK